MFSRSNHHHPRQRSNSLPQVAGQIRPRSPDSTNSESSEDAAAKLRKKSPHTDRVVKRGRLHGPKHSVAPAATQAAHLSPAPLGHSISENPQARPQNPTSSLPTALEGVVADHLKHLETLLDSVLATVVIIQSASTMPTVSVSSHAQEALRLLHTLVPMAHTPITASLPAPSRTKPTQEAPTRKSYAQATQTARPPPAGHLPRVRSNPKGTPPHSTRHSPYRLIARWPGHPIPTSSLALDSFVRHLDSAVSGVARRGTNFQSRIAGANVTKSGNLVIHTTAPFTAAQLREHSNNIKSCSNEIPGFDPPPSCSPILELDVPWHGIVVHDLPAASLIAAYEGDRGDDEDAPGIWEALEKEAGIPQEHIRDVRLLCRDEDQENRDHLSIRVMLEDSSFCDHLCRNGIFLIGTRCRVSRYRPRKKSTRTTLRPTSPHTPF